MTKKQSAASRFFLPCSRQVEHFGNLDDRNEPAEQQINESSESKQELLLTSNDKKANLGSDESIEAQHHETTADEDAIEPILSGKENTLEVESAKETFSNPFAKFAFVASTFSDQTKLRRSRPNNLVVAANINAVTRNVRSLNNECLWLMEGFEEPDRLSCASRHCQRTPVWLSCVRWMLAGINIVVLVLLHVGKNCIEHRAPETLVE